MDVAAIRWLKSVGDQGSGPRGWTGCMRLPHPEMGYFLLPWERFWERLNYSKYFESDIYKKRLDFSRRF